MAKVNWKDETSLRTIVHKSKFKKEVLIKMGLRAAGSNFKTLDKYLKKYKISTDHFEKNWRNMAYKNMQRSIPLSEILIKDSTYSNRSNLKKKLFKKGIKENRCEICGQLPIWNGKEISLILDHINGVHNDNRIENLRIVCPNCNATLPTHCGKNV